jgi:hypothetical protein
MRYLNYAVVSLASALVATYAALWIAHPTPLESTVTLPPLAVLEQPDGYTGLVARLNCSIAPQTPSQ